MPDYKEMYRLLFRETTKAIAILQQAQQQTEEMYIEEDENKLSIVYPVCEEKSKKSK